MNLREVGEGVRIGADQRGSARSTHEPRANRPQSIVTPLRLMREFVLLVGKPCTFVPIAFVGV